MAVTVTLPPDVLNAIAEQIGRIAPASGIHLTAADEPELAETLQIWTLPAYGIISPAPLRAAVPNGRWHHQIFRRGHAELFAYSRVLGPRASDWKVTAVFDSDYALEVDTSIDTADAAVRGSDEARMLVIPALQVHTLWITHSEGVLVPAIVPPAYRTALTPRHVYTATSFFAALRRLPHIRGVNTGRSGW